MSVAVAVRVTERPPLARAEARIDSLQLLRAVAAIMVAAFHLQAAGATNAGYDGAFSAFARGDAGVDLFFVISGFIIYSTAERRRGQSAASFLAARFFRIFPIYWTVLGIYLAAAGAAALLGISVGFKFSPASLIASTLLLPHGAQIIDVAWTLAIEVLFYGVFAMTFFRFGARVFFAVMIAWSAASVLNRVDGPPATVLDFIFYPAVAEFLFGAAIAWACQKRKLPFAGPALVAGVLLLLVWLCGGYGGLDIGRQWGAGIPAALIVYGAAQSRAAIAPPLLLLGEASYILYLTHLLAFSCLGRMFASFGLDLYASTSLMAVALVIGLSAASLATIVIERPYQRWYRPLLAKWRPA